MTELVVARGRRRRVYTQSFKKELVSLCIQPGMSLAGVARQHDLHPTLLARWVKERIRPPKPDTALSPAFVPVHIDSQRRVELTHSVPQPSMIEVSIHRGELRMDLKVQQSACSELAQILREVLR